MTPRHKQCRWLRSSLTVAYSVAVALVLLEIFLRVADPIGIRYYYDAYEYFGTATVEDSVFAYINTPNFSGELQGVDVSINSEGLRSPEFPVQKPAGEKRLLILGDSVVFGWGAHPDSIFPALLRARLAREAPEWSVISAGVGSWNTRTEYEWLRTRGASYRPDAILLVVVPNDVEPKTSGRTVVDRDSLRALLEAGKRTGPIARIKLKLKRGATRVSYAFATLSHITRRRATSPLTPMFEPDSPAWRDAASALDGIVALCRDHDIDLIVYLWGDGASDLSRTFMDTYTARLDFHTVPHYVLPSKVFSPRYRNSLVDSHPNSAGHLIIADALYETLRPIVTAR